jgi:hypothetical protein
MNQTLFALSLGFGGVILATHAANAAPQCGPRDAVLAALADQYGETRRSAGLASDNVLMEVFASDTNGTWTITLTRPDGITCLAASGAHFEAIAAQPPGDPA